MSDSSMIERVARAICNAHRTWEGRSADRQREIVDQAWPSHIAEARAAIEAMRVPHMEAYTRPEDAMGVALWNARIDEALAQPPEQRDGT